jgi:hypothetical protein
MNYRRVAEPGGALRGGIITHRDLHAPLRADKLVPRPLLHVSRSPHKQHLDALRLKKA